MKRMVLLLALLALAAALCCSQTASGLIKGAVVPGASCVLANHATGASRTAIPGPDGAFAIPEVQSGKYISGITSFRGGNPFALSSPTVSGCQDITGSFEDVRIRAIGDPRLDKSQRTLYRNFKTEAYAGTPQPDFGNVGINILL